MGDQGVELADIKVSVPDSEGRQPSTTYRKATTASGAFVPSELKEFYYDQANEIERIAV
jgi:hypothetical protein